MTPRVVRSPEARPARRGHFGDGRAEAADIAPGLVGAVAEDPVQDRVVGQDYLETVVKERDGRRDWDQACREAI